LQSKSHASAGAELARSLVALQAQNCVELQSQRTPCSFMPACCGCTAAAPAACDGGCETW
jgi:hypothetical protein